MRSSQSGTSPAAPRAEAPLATSTKSGTSASAVCEEAVRTFLQSLQPNLEVLLPKFLKAGIINGDCLVALAGFPNVEQDKLLRDDLCLTAFQVRVVCVGLANLSP